MRSCSMAPTPAGTLSTTTMAPPPTTTEISPPIPATSAMTTTTIAATSMSVPTASTTIGASQTSQDSSTLTMPAAQSPDDNSALIGGIVGAVALILVGALIAFCVVRSRRRQRESQDDATQSTTTPPSNRESNYGPIALQPQPQANYGVFPTADNLYDKPPAPTPTYDSVPIDTALQF
jgi:H+/gluconate symporter-like permease